MKKHLWKIGILLVICGALLTWSYFLTNEYTRGFASSSESEIKLAARRASVQVQFHIPTLRVTFKHPLPKPDEDKLSRKEVAKMLDEKLKQALEAERELSEKDKYQSKLTEVEAFIRPQSKTMIPIGTLPNVPKWAKYPEKVLVVVKTEKKEIAPWEKESEKDVLTISETAGVSISKAKEILSQLKAGGYSISKEDVKDDSEIKLIWFNDGWDDKYPVTLDWKVSYPDEKTNKIRGYDSRGIIETISISDDSNEYGKLRFVKIKVGYFDLLDEFKPKTIEVENLNKEIETLKNQTDRWKEEDEKRKAEEPKSKRDISNVTWSDVRMGTVKVENLWIYSAASGIFLGNMQASDKMWGSQWGTKYFINGETMGVILTNAHVSKMASTFGVYVSEDKEIMWIVFPAWPSVRYTQDSDQYGSPAPVLIINEQYVHSYDYDCGIMVTSAVPQYEKNKAILGNSNKVKEGDSVIMVGNPMYAQKFMTEGIVSNKNYTLLKSHMTDRLLGAEWFDRSIFNWLLNSNWWFDTPIGIGGTSGSGVWAMEGSERGKVVALHNMGLGGSSASKTVSLSEPKEMDSDKFGILNDDKYQLKLKDFAEENKDKLFKKDGFKSEKFSKTLNDFDDGLTREIMQHAGYYDIAGMNAGIPINGIKRFLQERGLDPEHFGFDGAKKEYWEK